MAGSSRPGSVSPPIDSCRVPPRTPGSLGVNDQADPNFTSLLGDTPGPLGIFDWADPTLPLFSSADPYSNLMCKDPDGPPMSMGWDQQAPSAPPSTPAPADTISLDKAQQMSLAISTYFEGGKSMNYQALADDFDGQGTSFGLIQWNFGSDTLGPLLKKMLDKDGTAFAACFGTDADYDTLKKALTDKDQDAELKWARALIKDHKSAWTAAFQKIGSNATFNQIQLQQAIGQYHPKTLVVIKEVREMSPTLFGQVEFRSYAAIFDLCVQQGGIDDKKGDTIKNIKKRIAAEKPTTQLDLMKIVVTERGLTAKSVWAADCVSRRMGILMGASFKATENDVTATRKNPQLDQVAEYGGKYVAGL